METKAAFREQGTPKSKKMLSGNKEKQGKFCWEQGNMPVPPIPHPPPPPTPEALFDRADYKKIWKS